MSKEIKVIEGNDYQRGSSNAMERDFSQIAGHYFYLEMDLPERKETSEREPGFHEKIHDSRMVETTYTARRAVKGGVTLLALRLHFTDNFLHSVELAAHPSDPNQEPLRFLEDEFFALFKPIDGEDIRADEIAKQQKLIQDLQLGLLAPPPNSTAPLSLSHHYSRPSTTDLVRAASRKDDMVSRATAIAEQAQEHMKFLQEGQKEIEKQTRVLLNYFSEKSNAVIASVSDQIAYGKDLNEGLASLGIYTGDGVSVHKIVSGSSADASIPLHLYQDRLYFDEEMAAEGIIGGFDFENMHQLGQIFSRDFNVIDRMIPAQRGVVLVRIRREGKDYARGGPATFEHLMMNLENETTYLLVRDGENVFVVYSDVTTDQAKHLFPTAQEIEKIFRYSGREIRPEHLDYSKARDMFERSTVFYKRMLLLLWGLNDRERIFGEFFDANVYGNWYAEDFQAKHLVYVYDAEGTLTVDRPTFNDWANEQNAKLQVGSRVAVNYGKLISVDSAPDFYHDRPNSNGSYSRKFSVIEPIQITQVVKSKTNSLILRAEGEGWGRAGTGMVRKTMSIDIAKGLMEDQLGCICIDDIEIADLNYYLDSRAQRRGYLDYFDMFNAVRRQIMAEDEVQGETRNKLLDDLLHGVSNVETAKSSLKTAIRLWRAQNGSRLIGDDDWTNKDRETVLNIAFALSGAQNDLLDRLKQTRPDLNVIEIRIDGKGQFWVYSEPSASEMNDASSKIDVVHVSRARLKVSKRNVSISAPFERVYLTNPKFDIYVRYGKVRNQFFKPVREETVVSNPELVAKWVDRKLPAANSFANLSASANLISIDAKNAIDHVNIQDFAQRTYEALRKPNGEGLVPAIAFVHGLAVVRSWVENGENIFVLCVEANALDFMHLHSEEGSRFADVIVEGIYKNPDNGRKRLKRVAEANRSPFDFTLSRMRYSKVVHDNMHIVHENDHSSSWIGMKMISSLAPDRTKVFETLRDAILNEMRISDKDQDKVDIIWLNEANKAFADELFDNIKDKPHPGSF